MTHDEFFAFAIRRDESRNAAVMREMERHRRACADCRELEREYADVFGAAALAPRELPRPRAAFEDELLTFARTTVKTEKRRRTRRRALRGGAGLLGLLAVTTATLAVARPRPPLRLLDPESQPSIGLKVAPVGTSSR